MKVQSLDEKLVHLCSELYYFRHVMSRIMYIQEANTINERMPSCDVQNKEERYQIYTNN